MYIFWKTYNNLFAQLFYKYLVTVILVLHLISNLIDYILKIFFINLSTAFIVKSHFKILIKIIIVQFIIIYCIKPINENNSLFINYKTIYTVIFIEKQIQCKN